MEFLGPFVQVLSENFADGYMFVIFIEFVDMLSIDSAYDPEGFFAASDSLTGNWTFMAHVSGNYKCNFV